MCCGEIGLDNYCFKWNMDSLHCVSFIQSETNAFTHLNWIHWNNMYILENRFHRHAPSALPCFGRRTEDLLEKFIVGHRM